jgi:hypothetical protein
MKEYKIDGFRFDFTKGFSNTPYPATGSNSWGSAYDAARIKILKRMYDEVKKRNPNAIVIFEHLSDNREEKELADYGILLWGNSNYNVNEATMGWGEENNGAKGNFSWASYKQRNWEKPHLISYMESHDEERIMYKNEQYGKTVENYNVRQIPVGLQRTAAAAMLFFSIPGPKMIWQFGELGYDISINYNGRLGKKPILWEYYDASDRRKLHDIFSEIFALKANNSLFSTSDYSIDFSKNFKYIVLRKDGKTAVAMANFDVFMKTHMVNFGKTGSWTEHFTKQKLTNSAESENITLQAGEYRLYFSD